MTATISSQAIKIFWLWRCPACNVELANPFSTKFCPKCGFKFYRK